MSEHRKISRAEAEREVAEGQLRALSPIRNVMREFKLREGHDYALLQAGLSHYSSIVVCERVAVTPRLLFRLAQDLSSLEWGVVVAAQPDLDPSAGGEVLFEVSGGGISLVATDAWASRTCRAAYALLGFPETED
ncbi:MAG: hypothetical protein ACREUW_09675 [Burkholderiales bacterium]